MGKRGRKADPPDFHLWTEVTRTVSPLPRRRVLEPAEIGRWLKQPNKAFGGSTPLQVVERGELDRLWRMLYDLESGQPG